MALYLVLWVLLLLSVIVGQFSSNIRTEVKITRNYIESKQAYYTAYAGLMSSVHYLLDPKQSLWNYKVKKEDSANFKPWRINAPAEAIEFGEGEYEVWIENESGKINLNMANAQLLRLMFRPFDIESDQIDIIVDSILDWRDKDSFHRLHGAEDRFYQSLPDPYECNDGDFNDISELLLIRGMTDKLFYGGIKDIVTIYKNNELEGFPDWKIEEMKKKGIKLNSFNYNKINVNAAPIAVLSVLPGMTDEGIKSILNFRKNFDIKDMGELSAIVGKEIYLNIYRYITFDSIPIYKIYAWGKLKESRIKEGIEAVVRIKKIQKKSYHFLMWKDFTIKHPASEWLLAIDEN
jgi:general secretion pathway protein K